MNSQRNNEFLHVRFAGKDSVWRILSQSAADADFNVKLKNNSIDLGIKFRTAITEIISYTYRF